MLSLLTKTLAETVERIIPDLNQLSFVGVGTALAGYTSLRILVDISMYLSKQSLLLVNRLLL